MNEPYRHRTTANTDHVAPVKDEPPTNWLTGRWRLGLTWAGLQSAEQSSNICRNP
jgi:hypothetical protein